MPHYTGVIAHRADGLHQCIGLAVFMPAPDFARPIPFFDQLARHRHEALFFLPAGMERARITAQRLLPAITGDAGKSVIDVDDRAINGGDHDAFVGVGKNTGGETQFFFGLFAHRDVAYRDVDGIFPIIDDGRALHFHINDRSVELEKARLDHVRNRDFGVNVSHPLHLRVQTRRMNPIAGKSPDQVVRVGSAKQIDRRRIDVEYFPETMNEDRLRRPLGHGPVTLFAFL